jgi:hypothetical protein
MKVFTSTRLLRVVVLSSACGFCAHMHAQINVASEQGKPFVGNQIAAFQSDAEGAIVASRDAWINLYYTEGQPFKLSGQVWLGGTSKTLDHPRDLPEGFALFIREWDSLHRYALTSRGMVSKRREHDNLQEHKIAHVHSFPSAPLGQWISFSVEATAGQIMYKFGDKTGVINGPLDMDGANKIALAAGTKLRNIQLELLVAASPPVRIASASQSDAAGGATAPAVDGLALDSDGKVNVAIQTIPGRTYRLEFKHDLTDLSWTPIGGPVAGTGEKVVVQHPAQDHGFYRVQVSP